MLRNSFLMFTYAHVQYMIHTYICTCMHTVMHAYYSKYVYTSKQYCIHYVCTYILFMYLRTTYIHMYTCMHVHMYVCTQLVYTNAFTLRRYKPALPKLLGTPFSVSVGS